MDRKVSWLPNTLTRGKEDTHLSPSNKAGLICMEFCGDRRFIRDVTHGNSQTKQEPFVATLPSARTEAAHRYASGQKPEIVRQRMQAESNGMEARSPPSRRRIRKVPAKLSIRDDPDPLQYIVDLMHAEKNGEAHYIQELLVSHGGYIVVFFTEFSMKMFLLLTANDGPYRKSCSTAMFDPQHGKEVFKMELVTRNLFLRNHPMWVGAFFLFIRTRELDFTTMLELLQRGKRFPLFASIRYADTDGESALRRALEGPSGTLKANVGMDNNHLKRCFRTWLNAHSQLPRHVITKMLEDIEGILDMNEDIEVVTQRLNDLVGTFPTQVRSHFERVHKEELLISFKSRAALILCERVGPDGLIDKGCTQTSESAHECGNRQAEAVRMEREAVGQPSSEVHCWTDAIRNHFFRQSRDFLCARTQSDSAQRLAADYSHLEATDEQKLAVARMPDGVSQEQVDRILTPPMLSDLFGPDSKRGSAQWNQLSYRTDECILRGAPRPGTVANPPGHNELIPEQQASYFAFWAGHGQILRQHLSVLFPTTDAKLLDRTFRLAWLTQHLHGTWVNTSLYIYDVFQGGILCLYISKESLLTEHAGFACVTGCSSRPSLLCVHKLAAYIKSEASGLLHLRTTYTAVKSIKTTSYTKVLQVAKASARIHLPGGKFGQKGQEAREERRAQSSASSKPSTSSALPVFSAIAPVTTATSSTPLPASTISATGSTALASTQTASPAVSDTLSSATSATSSDVKTPLTVASSLHDFFKACTMDFTSGPQQAIAIESCEKAVHKISALTGTVGHLLSLQKNVCEWKKIKFDALLLPGITRALSNVIDGAASNSTGSLHSASSAPENSTTLASTTTASKYKRKITASAEAATPSVAAVSATGYTEIAARQVILAGRTGRRPNFFSFVKNAGKLPACSECKEPLRRGTAYLAMFAGVATKYTGTGDVSYEKIRRYHLECMPKRTRQGTTVLDRLCVDTDAQYEAACQAYRSLSR